MKVTASLLATVLLLACGQEETPAKRYAANAKKSQYDANANGAANVENGTSPSTSQSPVGSRVDKMVSGDGNPVPPVNGVSTPSESTPDDADPTPKQDPFIPEPTGQISDLKVLVFSKTGGYRHGDSIEEGIKAMKELSIKYAFTVTATEDAAQLNAANLAKYNVVFFLNTTGEILNDEQKRDFEAFIVNGGGYVGTHSAADTLYNWPFYGKLLGGAWFAGHPAIQKATVKVEDKTHASSSFFADAFVREDEWYNYRVSPRANVQVLMSLDESTYQGGNMKGDHPITWCQEVEKGRSWYTGFGHTRETFKDPQVLRMILNGLLWSAGINSAAGP